MKRRRHWEDTESREVARYAHAVLLDGIFRARRWEQAEIAFQGGTCLNLVYSSPRFSEDLDFLCSRSDTTRVVDIAVRHLKERFLTDFPSEGYGATVKRRDDETMNPKMYEVGITAPNRLGKVKVKVEFWVTPSENILALGYPSNVMQSTFLSLTSMRVALPPVTVIAGELDSIFRDKIRALATRMHLKFRDCFDVWWMFNATNMRGVPLSDVIATLPAHLEMYPNGIRVQSLGKALRDRADEIETPGRIEDAARDIPRWFDEREAQQYGSRVRDMLSTTAVKIREVAAEIERQFPSTPAQTG